MTHVLVTARELAAHLEDPDWRIVDCRFELLDPGKGRADYLAGHIPGAVYAHLDEDLAAPVTPGIALSCDTRSVPAGMAASISTTKPLPRTCCAISSTAPINTMRPP